MDMQRLMDALKEFLSIYSELKEVKELKNLYSLSQFPVKDQSWFNSAQSFINAIKDDYPTFDYYLCKYWNGKSVQMDFQTMNDYLSLAALCVVSELFIETHKKQ